MHYVCRSCGLTSDWDSLEFHCRCGALWSFADDTPLAWSAIRTNEASLLRYLDFFPKLLREPLQAISLGEGWTSVVAAKTLDVGVGCASSWIKMDHLMPTASFKDRGAALLVALAKLAGARRLVQDSSGNAGHAVATYAARAGISCEIFVPQTAKPQKIEVMKALGATVHVIPGSREATADAALHEAALDSVFFASHVYNPVFYEGTSTFFFELVEQLPNMPENLLVPLGNGTLVLGFERAIERLTGADFKFDVPRLIAVQTEACAPIAVAYANSAQTVSAVAGAATLADGIAIARPARGNEILEVIRRRQGTVVAVSEQRIAAMWSHLAQRGLHVEPTTAATFAAAADVASSWVAPVCAAGIKA